MWEPQINRAILAMKARAKELDVQHGAGFVLIETSGGTWEIRGFKINKIYREPNPKIENDRGTNYVGIAWMKCAYSMCAGLPSGIANPSSLKGGEAPWRGCIILDLLSGSKAYFFFSGSTEENDVKIAKAGKSAFEAQ